VAEAGAVASVVAMVVVVVVVPVVVPVATHRRQDPSRVPPWPTFHHPWSGRISMWLFQGPGSEAHPPAAMFACAQPGFAFASPSP
jgi:hypothetical protein